MKLIKKVMHSTGEMEAKVSLTTSEDLWNLYNIIVPGDLLEAVTRRKVQKENSVGTVATEVKTLNLRIEVIRVEFTPDELRVQGVNKTPNTHVTLGAHHTLTIHYDPPQTVTFVKKEWDEVAKERLQDACNQEGKCDTAAILMDMGVANVILVTPSLMISKAKVEVTISKKHKNDGSARDKSIVKFFKQTLDAVFAHIDIEKLKLILLCSPGHVRDEFFAYMKEQSMRSDDMRSRLLQKNLSKFVLVKVNSCTHDGLREAFLDPTVAIKMSSTKCVDDIRVWERFQVTMNKDPDLCVYTPQCVLQAALSGAMCCLMISDVVFRSEKPVERRFYLSLVNFAKKTGGCTVNIFSSSHVTGEQLSQLGNIAAILLFACPDADDIEIDPDFLESEEVAAFIRENISRAPTA